MTEKAKSEAKSLIDNKVYPYYLAGQPRTSADHLPVLDKYRGAVVAHAALADRAAIDAGIAAAAAAVPAMRRLAAYQRQQILEHCVTRFQQRHEELAEVLCVEAGKPIRDSRGEVTRLIDTFKVAAGEATRIGGHVIDLAISERAAGARGLTQRVPVGACSFLTPFNFPLNLTAHKVAPAIAAGCPFILKPSERTPLSALIIGEVLAETDLPTGSFSVLPCRLSEVGPFIEDPRLALLSFTGSAPVGWGLRQRAGRKKVVLELGGNAACIVDEDPGKDLDAVVERLAFGAYYQSGQSCISVQRILAHESIYDALRERLIARVSALRSGDPRDEQTFIGPLIDEPAAQRIAGWLEKAVAGGAKVLCGGQRQGAMLAATLVEDAPAACELVRQEVFGPVAVLSRFRDFDEALREANDSDFGLQAGVFTRDLGRALRAWDELEVGGVVVGDVPSFRVDNMPYGGVKDSGVGREGVRSAIEDFTEPRLLVLRT